MKIIYRNAEGLTETQGLLSTGVFDNNGNEIFEDDIDKKGERMSEITVDKKNGM